MDQSRGHGGKRGNFASKKLYMSGSILADLPGSPVTIINMPPILFILHMLAAYFKSSCPR